MVEETKGEGIKLADAIAEYKAEIKEHKAKRTYVAYAYALDLFVKGCNKTYVDEISRGCIMSFAAALKEERAGQTVVNQLRYVYTFLKRHGKGGIVGENNWPKYEVIEYEIYTEKDVHKMLEACETLRERALILFPLAQVLRRSSGSSSKATPGSRGSGAWHTCIIYAASLRPTALHLLPVIIKLAFVADCLDFSHGARLNLLQYQQ